MIVVRRRLPDGTIISLPESYEVQYEVVLGWNAGYVSTRDGSDQGDFVVTMEDTVLFIVVEEEPQPDEVVVIVDIAVFDLNSYDSFGGVVPIVVRKGAECTLVTIVPDTLAPGDTAAVLVMKRQTDGTVVPYPPETLFSVTLLAGQGTLIGPSGDTSSTMLECVEQGFRYVAPDSITGSSLETHISAVLAEGCGGLRPVGGQSAGKMKDKGEETPRLSLAECPVFASVVVKEGGGCQDGVPCPTSSEPPHIIVQTRADGFAGMYIDCSDPRTEAAFRPVDDRLTEPLNVEPCRDGKSWRFVVSTIEVNTIIDNCQGNRGDKRYLNSLQQVLGISDKCCAWIDFQLQYQYPLVRARPSAYRIQPAIDAHERVHKEDFTRIVERQKREIFDLIYNSLHPPCADFTEEQAKEYGRTTLESTLRFMMDEVIAEWKDFSSRPTVEEYERQTQGNRLVKDIIKEFIDALRLGPAGCIPRPFCQ
jgi:hypothetical protein